MFCLKCFSLSKGKTLPFPSIHPSDLYLMTLIYSVRTTGAKNKTKTPDLNSITVERGDSSRTGPDGKVSLVPTASRNILLKKIYNSKKGDMFH